MGTMTNLGLLNISRKWTYRVWIENDTTVEIHLQFVINKCTFKVILLAFD